MAEPLPSASSAAADAAADNEDEVPSRLPKNAEDRKAAAALDSLNANEISQDGGATGTAKLPSKADQEALGKAMSRLEIATGASTAKKKDSGDKAAERKEVEAKKKIKVSAEDVACLVDELDLTKAKATELLKSHDGDVIRAAKAFILPSTRA